MATADGRTLIASIQRLCDGADLGLSAGLEAVPVYLTIDKAADLAGHPKTVVYHPSNAMVTAIALPRLICCASITSRLSAAACRAGQSWAARRVV